MACGFESRPRHHFQEIIWSKFLNLASLNNKPENLKKQVSKEVLFFSEGMKLNDGFCLEKVLSKKVEKAS